jgi:peptidoglycan/xylan/chitin deacetylase (PgdA/CDA1 family)
MLAVKPGHFAEQMSVIRSRCQPIPLQQLVDELQEKKLKNRAVAVTFDDGYADNLYQAKPVLERYEIPATVFVTAGHIGSQREFWWDELDRLLLQPGSLPDSLNLGINGREYTWVAGISDERSIGDYSEIFQRHRDWHVEREDVPHPRFRLFRELYEQIHSLPDRERQRVLEEIMAWTGAEPAGRSTHRSMTTEELVELEKGGLVEVGAHTMTHSDLAALPPGEQRQEIQLSKDILESIVSHAVASFAFPYGSNTPETLAILQEVGFESACATHADAVWPNATRFQLPRLGAFDWDQQKFAHWLSWWMDG